MSSIRTVDLLQHAQDNSYAIGYFEAWNLESLLAVVRAAEIACSPVMIGFCGEYLASPQRHGWAYKQRDRDQKRSGPICA